MSTNKNEMFNVLRSQTISSMIQNQIVFQKTKNGILIIHKFRKAKNRSGNPEKIHVYHKNIPEDIPWIPVVSN